MVFEIGGGKANLSDAVTKSKVTPELKNLSLAQKLDAILGSVTVDKAKVTGKSIVVVDDLYQSGLTINYVAEELREAGAKEVFGLTAVKTLSNDDNLPKTSPPPETGDDGTDEILFLLAPRWTSSKPSSRSCGSRESGRRASVARWRA